MTLLRFILDSDQVQYVRKRKYRIGFTIVCGLLIFLGYTQQWAWMGLAGIAQITTTITTKTGNVATVAPAPITLWNWLQVLIVPVILGILAYYLNDRQKQRDEINTTEDHQAAELQEYLTYMSDLILKNKVLGSNEGDPVRVIAEARTFSVLSRLNGERKGSVIQFLAKAGLINSKSTIISLKNADLKHAALSFAHLAGVDLSEAYVEDADLSFADLTDATLILAHLAGANLAFAHLGGADLRSADLREADLGFAKLNGANLFQTSITNDQLFAQTSVLEGTTMPDGTVQPVNNA